MARGYAVPKEFTVDSTGDVVITTTDLLGYTPVGALFVLSGHDTATDGSSTVHASLCIGFSDGTNSRFNTSFSEDGVTSSDTYRDQGTGAIIKLLDASGGTQAQATLSSFSANGCTINFSTYAVAFTMRGWVLFFAGEDAATHCNTVALGTGTSAIDVTAPGFQPDFVLSANVNAANASAVENFFGLSFGVAVRDGSDTQNYVSWAESDNIAAGGQPSQIISTSFGLGQQNAGAATEAYHLTFGSFDASGFSVTPSASAGSDDMNYLAVKLGVTCRLIDIATPTGTGDQSYTSAAPGPQCVLTVATNLESYDTSQFNTNLAGGLGICAFSRTESWGSAARIAVADPTDTANVTEPFALIAPNGTTILSGVQASFVSMNNDGFTINYSQVEGTAKKAFALIIGLGDSRGTVGVSNAVAAVGAAIFSATGSIGANVAVAAVAASTITGVGAVSVNLAVTAVGTGLNAAVGAIGINVAVAAVGVQFQAGTGSIANNVAVAAIGTATFAGVGTIGNNVAVAATSEGASEGAGSITNSVGVLGVGTSMAAAVGIIGNDVTVSAIGVPFHPLFNPAPFRTVSVRADPRTVAYLGDQSS